jgi:anthraniloyl-CoA monooxygenase
MRVLCIGGGPAGLYLALLLKKADPRHVIRVVERNRPYDTFGWGVVFSDQTLDNLAAADPETARDIADSFNHWDDIDVYFRGRTIKSSGHGFCGIGRKRLLNILQARCEALGVELAFEDDVADDVAAARDFNADVVIASDGLNSRIRTRYAETFQPDIDLRRCRFVWLGTKKRFPAFTFAFAETPHGWFQAHAYQYDGDTSTFIVETPEETWRAAGLDNMSQEEGIAYCEQLFAPYLDGNALLSNASHLRGSAIWIRFPRVVCRKWVHWNEFGGKRVPVILVGDAAHTAHFPWAQEPSWRSRTPSRSPAHCPIPARFPPRWRPMKPSAPSKCSRSRMPRAIRPSGSSTSSATRRSLPSSSRTAC